MKITFKRKGVAAWLLSAALVGIAGCGGGSSSQSSGVSAGEIVFAVASTASNNFIQRDLFRVNLDGSNLTSIPTSGQLEPDNPAWFPGRQEIVYLDIFASRGGVTSSIRRANRDGSNDREIVANQTTSYAIDLAVSPDKTRIASTRVGTETEIFVTNADGTNSTRLTQGSHPSWSPDGQRLIFSDSVDSQGELFTINADGSNRTRLTTSVEDESQPQFSPDGRRIVYTSTPPNTNDEEEVFVMNADGSSKKQLTNNARLSFSPKWTIDGKRLVFISDRNGNGNTLFLMNADGSNQTQIGSTPIQTSNFDVR